MSQQQDPSGNHPSARPESLGPGLGVPAHQPVVGPAGNAAGGAYGAGGYGAGGYGAVQPAAPPERPGPMPITPREYQQLPRGLRFAGWRPVVAIVLTVVFAIGAQLLLMVPLMIYVVAAGLDPMSVIGGMVSGKVDPIAFAYLIAGLASLIPLSMLANRIAHGIRPRYLSSVVGGFRWGWLARCLMITLPLFIVYIGLQLLVDGQTGPKPEGWIALLIMVVIGIPFQSAGEEYAFRGLLMQNVGAWFANPKVALIVSMIPSVLLFAAAHGSSDPWIFLDLAIFATASCFLVWRTGGLEASVALHLSNNVTIMIGTILFGGWDQAFVSSTSQGSPLAPVITLVVNAIAVALILWQAKRQRIQRIYRPSGQPSALGPAAAPTAP
ncbi:CPBP family intramembrane glutamic endopeptidase [Microlunatus soli]|uniref:Membrane protease YdiL, CAAX protease family n=1 Tax=Microlunatus soli TaxID=630515 RepID=A0A1H1SYS0_9ACTN|nr:CPBP family intramembrane glutamic endopeptidase [Microlunatus soli]SDS52549.1 Membrane protease YdiL, CAAX protease family [Microlunatus soli]